MFFLASLSLIYLLGSPAHSRLHGQPVSAPERASQAVLEQGRNCDYLGKTGISVKLSLDSPMGYIPGDFTKLPADNIIDKPGIEVGKTKLAANMVDKPVENLKINSEDGQSDQKLALSEAVKLLNEKDPHNPIYWKLPNWTRDVFEKKGPKVIKAGFGRLSKAGQVKIVRSSNDDCIICHEEFQAPERHNGQDWIFDLIYECAKCHKNYHVECLKTWFKSKKTCPHCNTWQELVATQHGWQFWIEGSDSNSTVMGKLAQILRNPAKGFEYLLTRPFSYLLSFITPDFVRGF